MIDYAEGIRGDREICRSGRSRYVSAAESIQRNAVSELVIHASAKKSRIDQSGTGGVQFGYKDI